MRPIAAGFAKLFLLIPASFALGCGAPSADEGDASAGASSGGSSAVASGGAPSSGGATSVAGTAGAVTSGGATASGGSSAASGAGGTAGGVVNGGSGGTGGPQPVIGACDDLGAVGQWQDIKPPEIETTQTIALDPFDIGTLWFASSGQGLFKSTDCGSSWAHVNTGIEGGSVDAAHMWSMAIDPVDQGTMYVIGAYGPQGLFKSTNGGVDFAQLFDSSSEFYETVPYNFVGSVAMDPHDHLHLVVGTHSNCTGDYAPACMAESTDGGASWTIEKTPFMPGWEEQTGPYIIDADTILYTRISGGMWLTQDHGKNWQDVTPDGVSGATGGEYTTVPISAGPDGTLYLPSISASGLMQSSDSGSTWERIENSPNGSYLLGITLGEGRIYLGDNNGHSIKSASLADLSVWEDVPALPDPNKPPYLRYDEAHHVLYAAGAGLARMVTQ